MEGKGLYPDAGGQSADGGRSGRQAAAPRGGVVQAAGAGSRAGGAASIKTCPSIAADPVPAAQRDRGARWRPHRQRGEKTYLPASDIDGKQWTMQYIQENGTKRFAKDSKKEGCFHVVGGMEKLAKAPAIIIAEGYATAATLKQSVGFATVSAFDSGNLAPVAEALHRKFPDKPIVIAGDDDRHLEITQGVNPGRTKAEEAAKLVGGKVLLPIFAPGESSYPAGLELVTVKALREHQKGNDTVSDEQLAALSRMKQFTDFNDLATKSALGQAALDRQVSFLVMDAIQKHHRAQTEHQSVSVDNDETQVATQAEKPKRRRAAKVA